MKKILFLSTLVLLISNSMLIKAPNYNVVPYKSESSLVPYKSEPIDKQPVANQQSITALIRPILINIATLAKYTFKVASNFKEIKRSAEKLKPDVECLTNRNSESCNGISCATVSKCTGTTISDLLRVIYPFLEAIFGSVHSDGSIKQGSLFAIVDTAEKIPSAIPNQLYTKLNATNVKTKIDGVVSKLADFRAKLPAFTKTFDSAMAMLNGIVLKLNPEMFIDTMPVKALPPIKQIESSGGLSDDLIQDIDTVLALPAPSESESE